MKITVTGSLGNISKPLAQELIAKGHDLTIISSKAEKQQEIEALGAKAAVQLYTWGLLHASSLAEMPLRGAGVEAGQNTRLCGAAVQVMRLLHEMPCAASIKSASIRARQRCSWVATAP